MNHPKIANKQLLKRRNSVFVTLQSIMDGAWIIGVIYGSALFFDGEFDFHHLLYLLTLVFLLAVSFDRVGVYRRLMPIADKSYCLLRSWLIAISFLAVTALLMDAMSWISPAMLMVDFAFGLLGQIVLHSFLQRFSVHWAGRREQSNALIVGTDQLALYLAEKINNNPWVPERVVGLVRIKSVPDEFLRGIPVLGHVHQLVDFVDEYEIKTLYLATSLDSSPMISEVYDELLDRNVDIHWAPDIFAFNLVNHSVKELSGVPLITLSETPLIGNNLVIKSVFDRLLALVVLSLLSPLMLGVALAIKLTSEGPVFFRQKRTGWNGEVFEILKFRSMRVHQEDQGKVTQATRDDPRITPVGRFIRRTSIDELPQLLNVFNGTMSLVGPRPHAVSHDDEYSQRIKHYFSRLRIKPGITGLAQVRGFRGETVELEEMMDRVESDLDYINNWSLWLDVSILFRTLLVLVGKKAY